MVPLSRRATLVLVQRMILRFGIASCALLLACGGAKTAAPAEPADTAAEPADAAIEVDAIPRAVELSALLVEPAANAMKDRKYELAITLYGALVVARGQGSDEALELARAWALQGQKWKAVAVYDAYLALVDDPDKRKTAQTVRDRLMEVERFGSEYRFAPATELARAVFGLGRDSYNNEQWTDAVVYYEMGFALDPDVTGFFTELGATYDALYENDKKIDFYLAYLRRRPFGDNADVIREALAGDAGVLGELTIRTAIECHEVWVNGQRYGRLSAEQPVQLPMAPGDYKALCFQPDFGMAYFEYATVRAGEPSEVAFNWAVVINHLANPRGRIAIEDARQRGVMYDLGIDRDSHGVLVPADGRALEIVLTSDDGTRVEKRSQRVEPGEHRVITW